MPFRFSLESILRFRKNVEHAEELALNKILQQITSIQLQLQRIKEDYHSLRMQRDRNLTDGLPAAYLQELVEKEQYLESAANAIQAQLKELDKQREAQLAVLRAAQQNREVLSEMRQQKHNSYQREQNQREQKALDDLFLSRMKNEN